MEVESSSREIARKCKLPQDFIQLYGSEGNFFCGFLATS